MSATMDSENFASYFRSGEMTVPILSMEPKRTFKIDKYFLNDISIKHSESIIVKYDEPRISDEMMHLAAELVFNHVQMDRESSILVFLPGFYEIENFENILRFKFDVNQNFQIIILHSAMPPDEQKLAFKQDDKPKIIISTNIAENSVTIPKVNVIVDFCLTKYLVASKDSNLSSLQLNWASQMSCEQRAGRTGRVCDGVVYHLVPQNYYKKEMPIYTEPEMRRVPLERVILKTKVLTNEPPATFLSKALDPPDNDNIQNSILILKEIGAMQTFEADKSFKQNDGEITFIGRVLASLPCDIYVGKFIILGHMFSVLEEAVIIGAGLGINGSIFKFDYKRRLEAYSKRLSWSDGSGSDLIAILNVYKLWRKNKREGHFRTPEVEKVWCEKFKLDIKNLYEVKALVNETRRRLEEFRIKTVQVEGKEPIVKEIEKSMMLKICVAGTWFPYFFLQEDALIEDNERVAYRQVDLHNVRRTIFFKDTERKFTKAYSDILKRALVDRGMAERVNDINIDYEADRTKIIVTFTREETIANRKDTRGIMLVDGSILPEVYISVKEKEISRGTFKLHVPDHSTIEEYAKQIEYVDDDSTMHSNQSTASTFTAGLNTMKGIITHVEHCGKFFFQPTGAKYDPERNLMHFKLRSKELLPIKEAIELTDGDNVVVNFKDIKQRAKVIKPSKDSKIFYNFFDLGLITCDIELNDVHHVPKALTQLFEIPPRCFECYLSEIRPSDMKCPQQVYTEEANEHFRSFVEGKQVELEIYSVVREVVSARILIDEVDVNEKMVEAGFAVQSNEDFNSRANNSIRNNSNLTFMSSTLTGTEDTEDSKVKKTVRLEPPRALSNMEMTLSGPHSPLETHLRGILGVENLRIKIDPQSVNSVVLNGSINSYTSRLYVAANVAKNRADGITLRELTMLPNVSLIFHLK
jgi:ATP-dependent RNA helicase TDRD9